MIINLPKHDIAQRSQTQLQSSGALNYLGLKEIPLSYLNVENLISNPRLSIVDEFAEEKREQIYPYYPFSSEDVLLLNENNDIIKKTMKRIGDTYYYEPQDQIEFTPLNFEAYLEVQRNQKYYNDIKYDIKVSAIDTGKDLSFTENLMSLFGNSYRSGQCPSNIRFNGGSTNSMTLLEQQYQDVDFVFTKSTDGSHYGESTEETDLIDTYNMLENHTNVWIFCDNYQGRFKTENATLSENIILHMNEHNVYEATTYNIPRNQATIFNQDISFLDSHEGTYEYEYMNEAILVIHKRNKGFIIISPSWFLDDLQTVAQMMYETIMKCYLLGYYKSRTLAMWITDAPVDYFCYQQKKFGHNHNMVTTKDFLADQTISTSSDIIKDIIVTTPYVRYVGTNNSQQLLFNKVGGPSDPVKDPSEVSFYTTKHTVINYKFENLSVVETPINIEFTTTDNSLYLMVHPYTSSAKNIHTSTTQTFKVDDLSENYILFVGKGSTDITSLFFLLKDSDIPESSWTKVATLTFDTEQMPIMCDARVMGGGIPVDQPNDYDMLDIGHIFGRPYRKGATLIIRLPIRLQSYEDRIKKEIDKHIAAGDEYIIIFEKRT